ncbi:hypothetical protein PTNB73_02045 [Pyrenophora teres f. teres]|nr:hypothetical protein HRS9122_00624 [Pyrenophora teres f. teres]KAE8872894.1 hypothetical protein PTNB73_02045 [Pyrenophora teres f. teres]
MGNHALIYGASGISGWAIVNSILNGYPSNDAFSRVTAMVNRPLTREMALWPDDSRLQIVSGVDLVKGTQEELEKQIKEKVKDVETDSHFPAYKQIDDPESECKTNEAMLERAVTAIDHLSSKLSYVLLPTGTKIYGCQMLDKFPFAQELPLKETLPPIPEPYLSQLFYYNQIDCLKRISKGKSWNWCEVRPDNIIGFVPNNNAYCLAQTLALYLSLYRSIEGEGAKCPFPGTEKSWVNKYNESPQDMVAHFSIYASLHSEKTASQSFNVGGQEDSWSGKWPVICDYFGLNGTGPEENSPQPGAYIDAHKKEWQELEKKHNLKKGSVDSDITHPGFQYFIMTMFDFDRQMSMEASHKVGYTEEIGTKETWTTAFDRMRKAKVIPPPVLQLGLAISNIDRHDYATVNLAEYIDLAIDDNSIHITMIPNLGSPRAKLALRVVGLVAVVCFLILLIFGLPRRTHHANVNIPLRILPLGDSITWGWQPTAQENGTDGYRAELIYDLIWARYGTVNYVGTQRSGYMYNNENEGHSGATISKLQGLMKAGLEMRPNVILLHIGTNDLARPETAEEKWSDAPERLGRLLDDIFKICPDAVVLVAKIIQAKDTQTRANVQIFNDAIPQVVDMSREKGFKLAIADLSIVDANELVDDLHPSYAGYSHMSDIWYDAIRVVSLKELITPPVTVGRLNG